MTNVAEDIVLEILLRLPVKSLLRFRCVCKKWCFLIKSPHFIHMHLAQQPGQGDEHLLVKRLLRPSNGQDDYFFPQSEELYNHVLNCYSGFKSLRVLTSPPDFDFDVQAYRLRLTFAGCVNGIVCVTNRNDYGLLNPALRECRTLPARPFGCPSGWDSCIDVIGFGFDDTTNDYKVVRVVMYSKKGMYDPDSQYCDREYSEAQVYSLRTNSWKRLGKTPDYYTEQQYSSPVFFNGCVHWVAMLICKHHDEFILAFNMRTESFQHMQFPEDVKGFEPYSLKHLFLFHESTIALVKFTDESDESGDVVNVWVMKEYGVKESWMKQYSITSSSRIEKPLSFWKKDKLVLVTRDGELVYYDLPSGELHQLRKYDPIGGNYSVAWSLLMVICNESLVSIKQVLE